MRFNPLKSRRAGDETTRLEAELANYRHAFETTVADRDRIEAELKDLKAVYGTAIDCGLWPSPTALEAQSRAIERGVPPVRLATLHKSGTIFVSTALAQTLDLPRHHIVFYTYPLHHALMEGQLRLFARGGALAAHHLAPSPHNLDLLREHGITRLVVHLRDPRQGAVSWWHHLVKHRQIDNTWPRERREAYLLEWYIRPACEWVMGWLEAAGEFDLHFSTQEEMAGREEKHLAALCTFFGQPDAKVVLPTKDEEHHFRAGRTDEWREFFSPDSQARAAALLPEQAREHFGRT